MNKLINKTLIFAAFVAPLGAKFLAVHTPVGELSLFRLSIILAFVFSILKDKGKLKFHTIHAHQKSSIIFFGALLLFSVISFIWSKDLTSWFRSVFFLLIALLAIITYSASFSGNMQIVKPFIALCFGILIQSVIGWFEVFTKVYFFRPEAENFRSVVNQLGIPVAMQYNSNNFALLMFIGSCIALLCMANSSRYKVVFLAMAVNYAVLAFLTASRAIILAYLIAAAYLLIKFGKKQFIIILFPIFLVLLLPQATSFVQDTLHFNYFQGRNSVYIRVNLIRNGLIFLRDSLGFGVGAGQIQYWMENKAVYYTYGVYAMHNFWMELLTSYGIIFFVAYLVLFIRSFFDYHSIDRSGKIPGACMICAALLGYIIGAVGPSSTMSLEWLWLFWGMCIAGLNDVNASSVARVELSMRPKNRLRRRDLFRT